MDADLEATCDALYEMACDVNDALYYQYHASMEEQYQSLHRPSQTVSARFAAGGSMQDPRQCSEVRDLKQRLCSKLWES